MSFNFTTSTIAIKRAGRFANATITADTTQLNALSDYHEGVICAVTGYDFVTNYASLSSVIKTILSDTASMMVAMDIILYSMGDYTSSIEATTIIDVFTDRVTRNMEVLKTTQTKALLGV